MEQVLQIINDHAAKTGNLSGISMVQVSTRAKLSIPKTKKILNQICAAKKARVREGINGKLLFSVEKFPVGINQT